jgi:hypothetical protein
MGDITCGPTCMEIGDAFAGFVVLTGIGFFAILIAFAHDIWKNS